MRYVLIAILLLALAPAALPDTPAGRVFGAWLAAFNSGDPVTIRAYLRKYHPEAAKEPLSSELQIRLETGGFDVRKILASTKTKISVIVQERASDKVAQMDFTVTDTPPYRSKDLTLEPAERPAGMPIPHLSQAQLIAATRHLAAQDSTAGRFEGALLIAKQGRPIFQAAYGLADRAHRIRNTVDTKFRIGSMNKMFTATAIVQLVQAGKIDLDKPFGTYLSAYPNKTVAKSVTIRELLNHTGGIKGDIFGPQALKERLKLRTPQDYIDLLGKNGLAFKPGSRFEYSNYGFIILGAVVQAVSGEDYYAYIKRHIYLPAGMNSSGSLPESVDVSQRSIGYTLDDKMQWVPNTDMLAYRASPAGGGYSTTGDLLRFANALKAHRLLNARYTKMMTTGTVPMPNGFKYGFGFGNEVHNGVRCFGHNGGAPGMAGDLKICDDGYTVVMLANVDPPAGRISDFIANRLPLAGP